MGVFFFFLFYFFIRFSSSPPAQTATLKFIVVILAAGMVAFVGAVICIIAAVHGGSPSPAAAASTAAQPLADNQSLTAGSSVLTFPSGSVARAGPMDALHGSGERNSPESPTFYGITGVRTGGDGGEQQVVTVSRLICTPVPAGECRPKGFQADDQSVYAGDQSGDLRTTAEELRRTVEQQEEEIRAEQRTIRELTGRLSVCESGTHRSEGLRAGRRDSRDGLMMQDDAGPPALTVRELERAIMHMKERIEKLEVHRQTSCSWWGVFHKLFQKTKMVNT